MFIREKDLQGYKLHAVDGEIGKVQDLYFDDQNWIVRYFVIEIGWILGKTTLISPLAVKMINEDDKLLHVNLTKEQVEKSPDVNSDLPVHRQQEIDLAKYYGWTGYWPSMSGVPVSDEYAIQTDVEVEKAKQEARKEKSDPHLRSMDEINGYAIHALDDEIGHVHTFMIDDDWVVRYLVVDTRNWLPGKKVLVAPDWISAVDWLERKVHVDLEKAAIESAPQFEPAEPLTRNYEETLYEYYGRHGYW